MIVGDGGAISQARASAVTGVGDVAYRARAVEEALAGTDGSADGDRGGRGARHGRA